MTLRLVDLIPACRRSLLGLVGQVLGELGQVIAISRQGVAGIALLRGQVVQKLFNLLLHRGIPCAGLSGQSRLR